MKRLGPQIARAVRINLDDAQPQTLRKCETFCAPTPQLSMQYIAKKSNNAASSSAKNLKQKVGRRLPILSPLVGSFVEIQNVEYI